MESKESRYLELQRDLKAFQKLLSGASDTILEQEVSSYPIFILHREPVAMGIPLYQPAEGDPGWHIHASTLEELATRKVVAMEKVDGFREVFKDPKAFLCLFVLGKDQGEFVFLPREAA
jgi:hypothetical protein